MDQLKSNIFGEIWTSREIERHLRMLCDRIGPRFMNTGGEKAAANYILDQFQSYGLDKVRRENFVYTAWKRGKARLTVCGPAKMDLKVMAMGHAPSTPQNGLRKKLAVVESVRGTNGIPSLRGKIVLIIPREGGPERAEHASISVQRAARLGAEAVILAAPALKTVSASLMGRKPSIPAAIMAREKACRLRQEWEKYGDLEINLRLRGKTVPRAISCNIIGEITGSVRPDEKIIVTAHYDSWDNTVGAGDDASGTAAVMELARIFSKHKGGFKRSLQFICFSGEEIGLVGSNAYARSHARDLHSIVLMLNIDPAGSTNFWVGGFAEMLRWLTRTAKTAGWQNRAERYVAYNTDCFPFLMRGVPAVWMMSRERRGWLFDPRCLSHGHTEHDTPDKVDIFDVKEAMSVVADTCLRLADAKHRPDHLQIMREVRRWLAQDTVLVDTLKTGGIWP